MELLIEWKLPSTKHLTVFFTIELSPDKYKIRCSFSVPSQAFQEDVAIVEIDSNTTAQLVIELKQQYP
jgi:hypothetical protein